MDNSKRCYLCGMSYILPDDFAEHKTHHNKALSKMQIVSCLKATKDVTNLFSDIVPPYLVFKMTGIGFSKEYIQRDGSRLHHNAIVDYLTCGDIDTNLIFLKHNRYAWSSGNEYTETLSAMHKAGFVDRKPAYNSESIIYFFTRKGFEALASCIQRDLICTPDTDS